MEEELKGRVLLQVEGITKTFERAGQPRLTAVDHVSFTVGAGECVGLVGESGSGKSTTASLILRLMDATAGRILLAGRDITCAKGRQLQGAYRILQAVFQDPLQSFDPRWTLGRSVAEPLRNRGVAGSRAHAAAVEMMERCGLSAALAERYPRQVSGGQCQRAAIARALMVRPQLLICDEATSALDVTVQREIVDLLRQLQRERGLALLFISHDLALVAQICDRVMVMRSGRLVESGPTAQVVGHPQNDYTKQLLDAASL